MSRLFFVVVLTVFCAFKSEATNLQSGDCKDVTDMNLAHYEEIKKEYNLFVHQYHVVNYTGIKPIKCIKAIDEWDNSSDIIIENGGIGSNFTALKIVSRLSKGIKYKVYIYTDDTGTVSPPTKYDNSFHVESTTEGNNSTS